MLKIEKNGLVMKIEAGGDLEEITADLCYAITALHQRLGQDDPQRGKTFRRYMVTAVTAPESPVWEPLEGATVIEIDKNAMRRGEGHDGL